MNNAKYFDNTDLPVVWKTHAMGGDGSVDYCEIHTPKGWTKDKLRAHLSNLLTQCSSEIEKVKISQPPPQSDANPYLSETYLELKIDTGFSYIVDRYRISRLQYEYLVEEDGLELLNRISRSTPKGPQGYTSSYAYIKPVWEQVTEPLKNDLFTIWTDPEHDLRYKYRYKDRFLSEQVDVFCAHSLMRPILEFFDKSKRTEFRLIQVK